MKKNSAGKRGPDPPAQTERSGWIRKFCGRGLFREIWKNRFVILRGDQLFICSKEVKDPGRGDEVLELLDFDRCEELRKNRSRSKKSHSKFRLLRSSAPRNTVTTATVSSAPRNTSLLFLALSPEEKESWIQVLNAALSRAKNRVLDQVTVDDAQLFHPTRDRAKIPHTRRPPTRGHLLAVAAASSDGALTLDLIHEEEPRPRTNTGSSRKHHTLPREVASGGRSSEKSASLDQIHRASSHESDSESLIRLQRLIQDKIQLTERLLEGLGSGQGPEPGAAPDSNQDTSGDPEPTRATSGDPELTRATSGDPEPTRDQEAEQEEARRLLLEAKAQWNQALQVLTEVQELKQLFLQLNKRGGAKPS